MLSDPNDDELYQIVVDLVTGEWKPLSVAVPYPDDDEPDPSELFPDPLTPPSNRDRREETQIDRSAMIPLPKEGFV